MLRPSDKHS